MVFFWKLNHVKPILVQPTTKYNYEPENEHNMSTLNHVYGVEVDKHQNELTKANSYTLKSESYQGKFFKCFFVLLF